MVKHGLGLSVVPRLALLPLRSGLVRLLWPLPLYCTLGMAVKPGRAGPPHIRAFTQALRAKQNSQGEGGKGRLGERRF